MSIPAFSISIFAETGDPEGIRQIRKSNWSGAGVVFTREQFHQIQEKTGLSQAGLYVLVGHAAEETIYIGEADPLGDRLKKHMANKKDWIWGVYFFDLSRHITKTEVQYLEARLVALAKQYDRAILRNKNTPTEPTMTPAGKATASAFLADMLLIFPILGIHAFTPLKNSAPEDLAQPMEEGDDAFDTVVVPAHAEGFRDCFLGENCWFSIRIKAAFIPKLKFIAAYQVKPVAAITHIAEIAQIVPYENSGKYMIKFKGTATAIRPIERPPGSTKTNMQSTRYALREKLLAAKDLDQVWG